LSVEDYPIWKFQLEILLQVNNLFKIMSLDKPIDERTEKWKKEDATAQKIKRHGSVSRRIYYVYV